MPPPAIRPQRVLIAGGSRGIGLAIAEGFVRGGAHVSICARNAAGLAQAADALAAHGTPVHALACDLADATQIDAYVQAAAQALGGLDVVINNASGFGHGNDDASWQAGLDVDLMAAVRCNRAALPYLRRSDAAVILNISSINAQRPTPRAIAYSTAKAALDTTPPPWLQSWRASAFASMQSRLDRSSSPMACGTRAAARSRSSTHASATASRSVASGRCSMLPMPHCFWHRRRPVGSPGKCWPWMAGSRWGFKHDPCWRRYRSAVRGSVGACLRATKLHRSHPSRAGTLPRTAGNRFSPAQCLATKAGADGWRPVIGSASTALCGREDAAQLQADP